MTKLIPITTSPDFAPKESICAEENRVEGIPEYKSWSLDAALNEAANWGQVRTGIWEMTPGAHVSIKGETFEFCHILSGKVVISENGGESHTFGAGDSFIMKPGMVGTWKTLETVKKIYVIAS